MSNAPNNEQVIVVTAKPIGKRTLAAIIGPIAAVALFVSVPADESGRKVEATIAPSGEVKVRHISGPQYLRAYLDIVGIATACDGITKNIRMGQTFTEAECTAMLERELIVHAEGVMKCTPGLRGPGRDWQRFAAVSFTYNVGIGAACRSSVVRRFNAGNYRGGCDALLMWNKAGGKVVRGLTLRRQRERAACLKGL
jgi:lysozyme